MKTARILSLVVGGVIALIALLMLSVWLFVDPNQYKPNIVAAVKKATGRDLVLSGDIKMSVFPWIALKLGPASLSNPAGFGAQPFVSFQHAAVRARLLPLLRERLEVARVEIDGLDLRMLKNAAGKGNWEGFGRADEEAAPAANAAGDEANPLAGLSGIKITHARLSYQNYVLENLTVETAPFADGVIPLSLSFDANRGVATEHARVTGKVDFSNPGGKRYRLAALELAGQVSRAGENLPVKWHALTPALDADLDAQTLAMPAFTLGIAGALMNGSLTGTKIIDDPAVTGTLTLTPLLLREYLPRWGLTSPPTRDPRAFSKVAGTITFAYGGNALRLNPLQLTLDDTHLQGSFAVENLKTMALKFALTVDQIDADRYRAPEGQPPAGTPPAHAEQTTAPPGQALIADGTLAVGSLHMSRLQMTNLHLTVTAKDGVTRVFPLVAQVDGGNYTGDVTLDSRGPVPTLTMDEHLSGANMEQLLATSSKSVHLSGKGNFSVKASGRGAGADAILKTLNGHVDAYVAQGAVEGVDLGFQLGRAESLIQKSSGPALQDTGRTRFDAFKMTADIANGVAQTKDLLISSPVLKVTGQGSTNLESTALDFGLMVDTLRTTQGVPIQLPVKVTGTTAAPAVRPDFEALAKGQLKQKLQDILGDKLKGLFGQP